MPIDFPDAPSTGDTHTVGDKTWTFDGTAWNLVVTQQVTEHGNLTGLGDDDHTQYLLADGTRTATELTVSGDLTVDTDTLHVDSTNNRVGIGTTTPSKPLHIVNSDPTIQLTDSTTNADSIITADSASGSLVIGADENNEVASSQIAFKVDGTTLMGLQAGGALELVSGGKIGVAVNNPVAQLDMPSVSSTGTTFSSNGWYDGVRLENSATLRWTKTNNKIWAVGQSTDNLYFGNTTSEGTGTSMAYHQVMYGDGYVSTPSNPFVLLKNTNTNWVGNTSNYTFLDSGFMGSAWTVVTSRGGNHFNTSTATFTAPVAGVYLYHLTTYMQTSGTGGSNYAHPLITINNSPSWVGGNTPYQIYGHSLSGYSEGVTSTYTVFLNQNDSLRPYWYVGSTAQIYPGYTSLAIAFLG